MVMKQNQRERQTREYTKEEGKRGVKEKKEYPKNVGTEEGVMAKERRVMNDRENEEGNMSQMKG